MVSPFIDSPAGSSNCLGPRSFLSICSAPGIQWVTEKLGGSPDFQHIGPSLVQEISRELKIERKLSTSRAPEPEREDVWRFVAGESFSEMLGG
jgi:hypothetical protein